MIEPKWVTYVRSINIIYTYIIYFSKAAKALLKKGIGFTSALLLVNTALFFILCLFPL